MKLTGKVENITIDRKTRKPIMTISLDRESDEFDDLLNCEKVSVEVKKYHPKRSLNANAYAWVLIDQLAEKLRITPEEVYRNAIKDIGGVSDIVVVKPEAVEPLVKHWSSNGLGWFAQVVNQPTRSFVILYYGSSVYDASQMGRLIDVLVNECKLQGIDTMTAEERSLLLDKWTN